MANCKGYMDLKASYPDGCVTMTDKAIMHGISRHAEPGYWDAYRHDPNQYACIRLWGTMLRREARRRGLI